MQLPTKRVTLIATGDVVTINLSDFDPAKHEELAAELAAVEPSDNAPHHTSDSSDALDTTPGSIASVSGNAAAELIAQADTLEQLDILEAAERASERHEGGRKGVLAAIAKRRTALEG